MNQDHITKSDQKTGNAIEVFLAFLQLGLTSFGGPIAHLSYFRTEFIEKRQWVTESQYGQLLTLCQFLPGPASSQVGFSLGLIRAGWLGALSAFIAFTLPSVLILIGFAKLLPHLSGPISEAAIHGLKIVALAVVAQGVLGMSRQLCPDAKRFTIAIFAAVIVLLAGSAIMQLTVVIGGAIVGLLCCRDIKPLADSNIKVAYGQRTGFVFLAIFTLLLLGFPLIAGDHLSFTSIADAFYRAGALVFGGGHVVLPLLEESVVSTDWVSQDTFLAGYGASQAIPGPMFSFSAYLGAVLPDDQGGLQGAMTALVFVFLPGFLLVAGVLPFWQKVSSGVISARALAGTNAAVVGLLGAALYDPIFTNAVIAASDLAIALIAFMLLTAWRLSALWIVAWCVLANMGVSLF